MTGAVQLTTERLALTPITWRRLKRSWQMPKRM
jgi:hypothetical protein